METNFKPNEYLGKVFYVGYTPTDISPTEPELKEEDEIPSKKRKLNSSATYLNPLTSSSSTTLSSSIQGTVSTSRENQSRWLSPEINLLKSKHEKEWKTLDIKQNIQWIKILHAQLKEFENTSALKYYVDPEEDLKHPRRITNSVGSEISNDPSAEKPRVLVVLKNPGKPEEENPDEIPEYGNVRSIIDHITPHINGSKFHVGYMVPMNPHGEWNERIPPIILDIFASYLVKLIWALSPKVILCPNMYVAQFVASKCQSSQMEKTPMLNVGKPVSVVIGSVPTKVLRIVHPFQLKNPDVTKEEEIVQGNRLSMKILNDLTVKTSKFMNVFDLMMQRNGKKANKTAENDSKPIFTFIPPKDHYPEWYYKLSMKCDGHYISLCSSATSHSQIQQLNDKFTFIIYWDEEMELEFAPLFQTIPHMIVKELCSSVCNDIMKRFRDSPECRTLILDSKKFPGMNISLAICLFALSGDFPYDFQKWATLVLRQCRLIQRSHIFTLRKPIEGGTNELSLMEPSLVKGAEFISSYIDQCLEQENSCTTDDFEKI